MRIPYKSLEVLCSHMGVVEILFPVEDPSEMTLVYTSGQNC
jgi:hypothetical protein